ncbi:hypothetical protein C2R22_05980 [Salinigranum rubrum]|uniref:Phage portal protein n=1 Tax=Salinigranum rubrum TaxID=755307 RepID=A0A2I8VH64_9EURY|nr:hypothetical protein [Salinigranum rubrum]AUV81267.1 hypothetical protein C2R22_05980 [Salinigranum rubrum]
MSFFDRLLPTTDADSDDDAEQLGPDDPAPRGESRSTGDEGFLISSTGGLYPYNRGRTRPPGTEIVTERSSPPDDLGSKDYDRYAKYPIVRASLQTFSDTVLEPGWRVEATRNGETDEQMTEALSLWGSNCAIYAGETGKDLRYILDRVVRGRREKGTLFMEYAGTRADPTLMAALILHKPETFKQYHRADTAILAQPDDPVDEGHPMVAGDPERAAAYVQYDDDLSGWTDADEIPFTINQLAKFVYDADEGEIWGESIFVSIGDRIDALDHKLDDRDIAIRQTGHPHRIYSSETWTQEQAENYAEAHEDGDVSSGSNLDADDKAETFAGRVDFVPATVEITTETGSVADIDDAVMDDLQHIFAVLPVSRFKVAYEEDINQFVVEPQQEKDDRLVDDERRYLEDEFEPVFERKADELVSGDEYPGEVSFRVEPDLDENPLRREDFPTENLEALGAFIRDYYQSGATSDFPPAFAAMLMGVDLDEMGDRLGFEAEALAESLTASEETEAGRDQLRALKEAPGVEELNEDEK